MPGSLGSGPFFLPHPLSSPEPPGPLSLRGLSTRPDGKDGQAALGMRMSMTQGSFCLPLPGIAHAPTLQVFFFFFWDFNLVFLVSRGVHCFRFFFFLVLFLPLANFWKLWLPCHGDLFDCVIEGRLRCSAWHGSQWCARSAQGAAYRGLTGSSNPVNPNFSRKEIVKNTTRPDQCHRWKEVSLNQSKVTLVKSTHSSFVTREKQRGDQANVSQDGREF